MKRLMICSLAVFASACSVKTSGGGAPASLPGVASVTSEQQATEEKPPLARGAPCGLEGLVEDRMSDCSRAPDFMQSGFMLVSRFSTGMMVYKDPTSGLLIGSEHPNNATYVEAKKTCESLDAANGNIQGHSFRLPTRNELEMLGSRSFESVDYDFKGRLMTSTLDQEGWVLIYDVTTSSEFGYAHPDHDHYRYRCVAK